MVEWQHLQQGATQTVTAVEHIAERMTTEARNFGELLTRQYDWLQKAEASMPMGQLVKPERLADLLVGFGANLQPGQILGEGGKCVLDARLADLLETVVAVRAAAHPI